MTTTAPLVTSFDVRFAKPMRYNTSATQHLLLGLKQPENQFFECLHQNLILELASYF